MRALLFLDIAHKPKGAKPKHLPPSTCAAERLLEAMLSKAGCPPRWDGLPPCCKQILRENNNCLFCGKVWKVHVCNGVLAVVELVYLPKYTPVQ